MLFQRTQNTTPFLQVRQNGVQLTITQEITRKKYFNCGAIADSAGKAQAKATGGAKLYKKAEKKFTGYKSDTSNELTATCH